MPNTYDFQFPLSDGNTFQHSLNTGDILFLLGANGTGKSSLVTRLYSANRDNAKRISAHRQTWFESNFLNMTPSARNSVERQIRGQDGQDRSRHMHTYSAERTAMAIFDLIDADTMIARKIADLVRLNDLTGAGKAAEEPAP